MNTESTYEFIEHIDAISSKLYEEYINRCEHVVEIPCSYHFWCEKYQPNLYRQREVVINYLVKLNTSLILGSDEVLLNMAEVDSLVRDIVVTENIKEENK